MQIQKFADYQIFQSTSSDGTFFLENRLPIFADWIVPNQVHKDKLAYIKNINELAATDLSDVDGIVSCVSGILFGVKLADCNGIIFLGDTWYAIIHAGWRGLHAGIVQKTITSLLQLGEKPEKLFVFCSPSIRACCYEVGDEFIEYFPSHCILQDTKKYHFDAVGYIGSILTQHRIPQSHIQIAKECTCCNEGFYSYRKNHTEDRMVF